MQIMNICECYPRIWLSLAVLSYFHSCVYGSHYRLRKEVRQPSYPYNVDCYRPEFNQCWLFKHQN